MLLEELEEQLLHRSFLVSYRYHGLGRGSDVLVIGLLPGVFLAQVRRLSSHDATR